MSIFNLHSNVLADYRDFVRSFFTVDDDRAREFIERELVQEARLWPEALLQVSRTREPGLSCYRDPLRQKHRRPNRSVPRGVWPQHCSLTRSAAAVRIGITAIPPSGSRHFQLGQCSPAYRSPY